MPCGAAWALHTRGTSLGWVHSSYRAGHVSYPVSSWTDAAWVPPSSHLTKSKLFVLAVTCLVTAPDILQSRERRIFTRLLAFDLFKFLKPGTVVL